MSVETTFGLWGTKHKYGWTSISHLILDETYTKSSFYFIDPYAQKGRDA